MCEDHLPVHEQQHAGMGDRRLEDLCPGCQVETGDLAGSLGVRQVDEACLSGLKTLQRIGCGSGEVNDLHASCPKSLLLGGANVSLILGLLEVKIYTGPEPLLVKRTRNAVPNITLIVEIQSERVAVAVTAGSAPGALERANSAQRPLAG